MAYVTSSFLLVPEINLYDFYHVLLLRISLSISGAWWPRHQVCDCSLVLAAWLSYSMLSLLRWYAIHNTRISEFQLWLHHSTTISVSQKNMETSLNYVKRATCRVRDNELYKRVKTKNSVLYLKCCTEHFGSVKIENNVFSLSISWHFIFIALHGLNIALAVILSFSLHLSIWLC